MSDVYKQVILVRHDLKLPKGKLAVQVAHASVEAVLRTKSDTVKRWHNEGMKKIVLKVDDLKALKKYMQLAKDAGLITALIKDAGKTVVAAGTITCCAIGPCEEVDVDALTRELNIL